MRLTNELVMNRCGHLCYNRRWEKACNKCGGNCSCNLCSIREEKTPGKKAKK